MTRTASPTRSAFSRQRFLTLSAATIASAVLAACGGTKGQTLIITAGHALLPGDQSDEQHDQ